MNYRYKERPTFMIYMKLAVKKMIEYFYILKKKKEKIYLSFFFFQNRLF